MINIYLLLGLYVVGVFLLIRFCQAVYRWDEEIEEMDPEDERERLLETARRCYRDCPLSEALRYEYREYQYTLKLVRHLKEGANIDLPDGQAGKQNMIDTCLRKMRIIRELIVLANLDEQYAVHRDIELNSSFQILTPNQGVAA